METVGVSIRHGAHYWPLLEDVSLILFWSMIESGAAIIAACLPTLRYLFGQSMVDKLLRSIRSTFSLHSQASRSWPSRPTKFENRISQGSSVEHIAGIETVSSVESYAMRDLGCSEVMRPPNGAINIQHNFRQQESYVWMASFQQELKVVPV